MSCCALEEVVFAGRLLHSSAMSFAMGLAILMDAYQLYSWCCCCVQGLRGAATATAKLQMHSLFRCISLCCFEQLFSWCCCCRGFVGLPQPVVLRGITREMLVNPSSLEQQQQQQESSGASLRQIEVVRLWTAIPCEPRGAGLFCFCFVACMRRGNKLQRRQAGGAHAQHLHQ